MTVIRSVCVFCGSRVGDDPEFRAAARRLGEQLARRGIRLVYGGGSIGLMGVLADAVLKHGGAVHGVIPEFLDRIEVGHRNLTSLDVVESMHLRKGRMFEMSDAFVVLPGGLGTLDETMEILTWRQLGLHDKPVLLVDQPGKDGRGYWEPLLALLNHTVDRGFAGEETRKLFQVVGSVHDVWPALGLAAAEATGQAAPAKVL